MAIKQCANGATMFDFGFEDEVDETYTQKISVPQYVPTSQVKPYICTLIDKSKVYRLLDTIKKSNVSEEEKEFLKFAAMRHLVFNYSQIAEYYAHSNKEMQELMEQSALVILDINDAIANGYVQLSKNVEEILNSQGEIIDD